MIKTDSGWMSCLYIFLSFFFIECNQPSTASNSQMAASLVLFQSTQSVPQTNKNIPADTADIVTYAPNHTGKGFLDSNLSINGVRGGGMNSGSGDVYSLSKEGITSILTLEWKNKRVLNGSGVDFIVFENPFYYNGDPTNAFMEAIIVEVSLDNINYCGFSPNYTYTNKTEYSRNPLHWQRFAGITPVLYNIDTNPLTADDLYNPKLAGGDAFDLDNLSSSNEGNIGCTTDLRDKIKTEGFIYLRLTSATARVNPDTGQNYLQDTAGAYGGGPDIDGVIARYRTTR